jgi:uncharacterized membrane protein YccC
MRVPQLRINDPGLISLKTAVRSAIIMPAVFALSYEVIQNPQTATFAAFGSFAILIFADFGGPVRSRLTAYLALALAGAVLIVIGTLCSRNPWLAAGSMAVIGFVILFSGAINGYFAVAATAAILPFVLPVSIAAPLSVIPSRLAGWGLAAGAGICAVMLLWPPRQAETLRDAASRACLALADLTDAARGADQQVSEARATAATQAVDGLRKKFEAATHRPTGPTSQAAALAGLIDELTWLVGSLRTLAASPVHVVCRMENGEMLTAVAAVLRASGGRLAGRDEQPDADRLDAAQEAAVQALTQQLALLPSTPDDEALESLLGRSFKTRAISYATRQAAAYVLGASGGARGWSRRPRAEPVLLAAREFAGEHAGTRSVSFRNSIRGAAGLAVAVYIAQRSGLQHSFWVVLGTLSVLRSNALGTSRSVVGALAGTAAGIVVGAAILEGVGSSTPVLWGILPVAVLIAAYAPRAISFAVGQAAFTIVLVVLFNIIQPVGWKVGLIRIEDVAIGFAVSLGVGLVFWPRGASTVLRQNMAAAYSRAADYMALTARQLTGGAPAGDPHRAEQAATNALHQLDDAYRQYLAEPSARRADPESAARLVAGASRVVRTGRSMAALTATAVRGAERPGAGGEPANGSLSRHSEALDDQVQAVRSWYVTLGDSLANGTSIPEPQGPDRHDRHRLLQDARDSIADGNNGALRGALLVLWASEHLDMLRQMEAHLGEQAAVAPGTPLRG